MQSAACTCSPRYHAGHGFKPTLPGDPLGYGIKASREVLETIVSEVEDPLPRYATAEELKELILETRQQAQIGGGGAAGASSGAQQFPGQRPDGGLVPQQLGVGEHRQHGAGTDRQDGNKLNGS